VSGGPYADISGMLGQNTLQFTDSTVSASSKYFYVVTSVDVNGLESVPSTEVSAQIP
jgi:fibronectin type 3 domain-containing protein